MTNDDDAWLRWHITHLVRVWTALDKIRRVIDNETIAVFKDVCSDKLRLMLYELAEKKRSMGFDSDGTDKHRKFYAKLKLANEWFTGNNGLHARNCSGAHLQPLPVAQHMFQIFGYGGEREWKMLTLGVAACVGMMKLIESKQHKWWRELRKRVRDGHSEQFEGLPIPASIDSLLIGHKIGVPCQVDHK